METTKNNLTQDESFFFNKLSNYLDTKLYFYGSIQRDDYIQKYSDIDVDIFTNNEKDIIIKLENFLDVKKEDFKKTLCIMDKTNKVVKGYKIKYIDNKKNINVEIAIFNKKYKDIVLECQKVKFNISYVVCLLLIFIKTLYYKFNIIPKKIFRKVKNYLIGITEENTTNYIILNMD